MSFEPRALRDVYGRFATGVTVLTAQPDGGAPFGMTVNSFSSLSLDPPLILWNLQESSDIFERWRDTTRFGVNILTADQEHLSARFATPGQHDMAADEFRSSETGCPLLSGTLASFVCDVYNRYPEGDHVIIVGRIIEIAEAGEGAPLLFYRGRYDQLEP
ncbi:MAG: flavin reductase family protein [Gammaproteobacteria bacterium]|nr:flavin reductase family protein [Gammaproteobacteria bacterium]NNM00567.1 flavin reductase family protein [Gammaproteobacteria bacterium]